MPVPTSATSISDEIDKLLNIFEGKCEKVEMGLESLDESKQRNQYLQSILRREYARTLSTMSFIENETTRLLRTAVMHTQLKAKSEANRIKRMKKEILENPGNREKEAGVLSSLEKLVEDTEFLRRNSELNMVFDQDRFQVIVASCFYFKTLDCDPKKFKLDNENVYRNKVVILTEKPNSFKDEFLLNSMEVMWCSLKPEEEDVMAVNIGTLVVKDTLRGLMKRNLAKMVDKHCLELELPPSQSGSLQVHVTLLGTAIENSIQRCKTKNGMLEESRFLDEKSMYVEDVRSVLVNNGKSMLDVLVNNGKSMLDLDQSDIRSLDMTKRKEAGTGSLNGRSDNPRVFSDGPSPLGAVRDLPTVQEVSGDPLNVSTPFSIASEAQYSTMRETSAAKLAEMLASASASVSLTESDSGIKMKGEDILAPMSESGRKSVEEMQKSLSNENSPSNSKEIIDIDGLDDVPATERSILFAPKTTIYQELATPQVKQDNKRYQVKEGKTKERDGVAGIAAMQRSKQAKVNKDAVPGGDQTAASAIVRSDNLQKRSNPSTTGEKGGTDTQVPISNIVLQKLPELEERAILARRSERERCNWTFGDRSHPQVEIKEEEPGDDTRDKTVLEDSIWEDHDLAVQENAESHPLENSRWEESLCADPVQGAKPLDGTIWDVSSLVQNPDFSFVTGNLKVDRVFTSRSDCLQKPTFMTHLKTHKAILIVETTKQRIGVYDDCTLEQVGWFPDYKNDVVFPLHILALSTGEVALVESKNGIGIYERVHEKFYRKYMIRGEFKGLVEAEMGELVTIEISRGQHYLRIISLKENDYQVDDSVKIEVARNDVSKMAGTPRYLAYFDRKVYISDMGVARIYVIDLVTREQITMGSYGKGLNQFRRPLSLLVDDVGNLLVADSKNGKLHVFNANGQHVKKLAFSVKLNKKPYSFLRIGHRIHMTVCDEDESLNGIVSFELEPASNQIEEERRVTSPMDILI